MEDLEVLQRRLSRLRLGCVAILRRLVVGMVLFAILGGIFCSIGPRCRLGDRVGVWA